MNKKNDLEELKKWIESKGFSKMDNWFKKNIKYHFGNNPYAELIEPVTMGLNPEETINDLEKGYVEACKDIVQEINKRTVKQ